jgi:hypothetical protein
MDKLRQVFNLPETVPSETIKEYLDHIINLQYTPQQKTIVFDALYELSDKQWHNYEPLDPELRDKLESWIIKNMDISGVLKVNTILGITGMFGLKRVYAHLIEIAHANTFSDEIKIALAEGIDELKNNIDDPWSGMK